MKHLVRSNPRRMAPQRRLAWTGLVTVLGLLLSMFPQVAGLPMPTASAHNLDASAVYVYFDPNTQTMLDNRINAVGWAPPTPLLQAGDELGLIIKALPDTGTTTGVGGYTTYYIPNGVQVVDAAYLMPGDLIADGITGYDKVPMKGQAQMPAVGAGGGPTTGLQGIIRGPNVIGITSPIVTPLNVNLGTLPGVYGDTGIFYSTEPETAYGTYTGGTIKNNSGDTVGLRTVLGTPLNEWDAWQMQAYGIAGTTNPAYSASPVIDSNGRGNAPWGLANVVAGPQSGYAWEFDKDKYDACDPLPYAPSGACIDGATQDIGPWQRIKYPGSQFSDDPPGANPAIQPYTRGLDASASGFDLTAGDLPATTGQANSTPNAIRWAYGQLTYNVPEYVWVKIKVIDTAAILDATGCPTWTVDTFGGDAGGDSGGKDHIWRYYDPNSLSFNGCLAVGKPATKELVKVGDAYQYKIKVYNMANGNLSNVIIKDTLPSGVTYLSAVPAPSTVALPNLTWNIGPLLQGEKFEAIVTVKASGSGVLNNTVTATATKDGTPITATANDKTVSGSTVLLRQNKTVLPTSVAPGGTVQYTLNVDNIGSGPTGTPVLITEDLPPGFSYVSKDLVTINGANLTATTTVNATNPNAPVFSVPAALQPGQSLIIEFTALVAEGTTAANYCNTFKSTQNGINVLTGALACVDVGGGTIGDTLFRDWNGDGVQDVEDEGLAGVTMKVYAGLCPPAGTALQTQTTDINGFYQFTGLTAGDYCTVVDSGVPAGYTITADPVGGLDGQASVTLATNEKRLDIDFGYDPGGAGSIGDTVFDDQGNDGLFNGADVGIANVTVNLYEDTNGNGVVDAGDALVATQVTSDGTLDVDGDTVVDPVGYYRFRNLAEGLNYIVDVVQTDPDILAHFGGSGIILPSTVDPRVVQGLTGAYTAADFGFYKVIPGSIGDKVWYDADADGVLDATEVGLGNVSVRLYGDANGNGVVDAGEVLLATTITDASGEYSFNDLPAGTYIVDVVETDTDIPDSLAASRDPIAVTLGVEEHKTDVDFPFVQALTKSVDKTTALAGEQLTYTVYPRYFGSALLTGASVSDPIPAGTTYVAASITAGGEAVDADETPDGVIDYVAWDLGSNAPGSVGYSGGTAMCPATQTIVAGQDTFIDSSDVNANNGSDATIEVDSDKVFNGLVQFTLPALPSGAVLDRAELLLTVESGQGINRTVSVRKLLKGPWTEGTSNATCTTGAAWQGPNCTDTWTSGNFGASDYGPQLGGTIAPATDEATYATVVTSTVTEWYTTPTSNYGFVLLATGSDTGTVKFHSRTGTAGKQPRLLLTYRVPTAGGCSGTVSLADIADTYIQEDSGGNDNFGTSAELKVRPELTKHKHALLLFDVGGIPVGATLSAATLKVNVRTAKANTASEIHGMTTAWIEGTNSVLTGASWDDPNGTNTAGTWANSAGFSTADYNATTAGTITPGTTGFKTADVKTLVLGWQNAPATNKGLVLLTTGTSTADASYRSREDGTAANRPVIDVSWVIPPADPTRVNTLSAGPLLVVEGDTITVKMVLENRTATAVANVTPSALTVTAGGSGTYSCATLTGPSPASQNVPANGSAAFTWTCTTGTTPTLPGTLTFSATASGDAGATTWALAGTESVLVTPPLTFKAQVNNPTTTVVALNQANMALAFPATQGSVCYVMADGYNTNDTDYLQQVDRTTGAVTPATPVAAGTQSVEAMAWSLDFLRLYAVNANQLGTLDTATGLFSARPNTIASATRPMGGEFGDITLADVDGISFDPASGVLYGVHRREGTTPGTLLDVLIKIDPLTGMFILDAFGVGVDYRKIDTAALGVYDVDDISFDPVSGALYGIANGTATSFSTGDRLVIINKTTGAVTDVARITKSTTGNLDDVEGLSFFGDGALFATTGYHAATGDTNKLWYLDKNTAVATERAILGTQATYNDYEAVACQGGSLSTASTPSNEVETALSASIGDFVWSDLDGNGFQDPGEPGLSGVEVCATPVGGGATVCHTTDAFGGYRIYGLTNGVQYNVTLTPATVPGGTTPTTPTTLTVTATTAGTLTADFGLRPPGTASIGDTVWLDADNSGALDGAEAGLPNITVQLYIDQNNDGFVDAGDTLLRTTTTDINGNYLFDSLHPDDYLVVVDETSAVTSPYDGATTIAAAMDPTTGTVNPRDVTITTAGESITTADFGYNWSGSIGDFVWWDDDLKGDDNEGTARAIAGAVVLLYFDANDDGVLDPAEYTPVDFTMTDVFGAYSFNNLPPGNYLVDVYEDSFTVGGERDAIPTTPDVVSHKLAPSESFMGADFGYYKGALVEGHVFHDADRNGLFDSAEGALSPVTVTLTGVDNFGNPVPPLTTDTDAFGYFKFLVPEGTYTITYSSADVLGLNPALGDATTSTSYTVTALAGPDWHVDLLFGVDNSGAIGDTVWNDADGNFAQNGGEPGLAGVTVMLYQDNNNDNLVDANDDFLAVQVTDGQGHYLFEGLADGNYVVAVNATTLPANFVQTYDNSAAQTDSVGQADIPTGGDYTIDTADFGYQYTVPGVDLYTISGLVYNDANNTADYDTGEAPFAGVDVTVVCNIGTFVVPTDSNGLWSVAGIPAGSTCTVLNADETDLPRTDYVATETPPQSFTVNANITDLDFGYNQLPGSISGTVCDGDGDGLCEPGLGEAPLAGVPVTLQYAGLDGILGTGDDALYTTNTDGTGHYAFTNLEPGLYQIVETNPAGFISLADSDGGNPDNTTVLLGLGVDETLLDFEDTRLASVAGTVFEDLDGDGQQDAGEPGIAGVTVTLDDGDPGTAPLTATTNALGDYEFTNLYPGAYTIVETDPAGYTSTGDADGSGNGDSTIAVTLASGQNVTERNFGDERPGSIAGLVFEDLNNNGVQDVGENPLITVKVCASSDGGTTNYCAWTDEDGLYTIPDVPPGDYVVTETDPSGYVSTTPNTLPVSVSSGEAVTGVNYGDEPPAANTYSIAGTVCGNVNGDGVCDMNEDPLPGVTVKLYDATGALVATTTTNAGGDYLFVNVPPGTYSVVEVDPIGYASVNDADGGVDNTVAVTVAANVTDKDFVDAPQPGALSGTVYEDLNLNGQRDPGEWGIAGVTVILKDATGTTTLATTLTDAGGNYSFPSLAAGVYTIVETDKPGYISTGDVDGANDNSIVATVVAGQTTTGQDFGDVRLGSISGTVWNDLDEDGAQDLGEPPLPGVLVCAIPTGGGTPVCDTTDANGNYTLPNLPPGDYTVVETDPAGYVSTTPNSVPVTLPSGGAVDLDFGDTEPDPALGSIGGAVCVNVDGDGVCDPTEAPLAGVTVQLWLVGGGAPLRTTTTDSNGDYAFPNLPAGSYEVREVDPTGYSSVNDANGGVDNTISPIAISGNAVVNQDFVDTPALLSISGMVCNDLNGDGVCGAGEAGLDGVTVKLYDSDGVLVASQVTAGGGLYTFANLPPGDYTLVETDLATYISTGDVYGANDNTVVVSLTPGVSVTGRNFADTQLPGAITGTVYNDLSNDGAFDPGEPGIAGVEVCLTPSVCTTTNASGGYSFTDLPPGAYTVTETQPAGYTSSGDVDGANDNLIAVFVPAGVTVTDRDFFEVLPAPSYTVTKTLVEPDPSSQDPTTRVGRKVIFNIHIVNTGNVPITVLPLRDEYSTTFLTYGFGGDFATPASDDNANDGWIDWSDLTVSFGHDLMPGTGADSFFDVTVVFTAREDTTELPLHQATNKARVHDALADLDGPGGLEPLSLPDADSTAAVVIYRATGVVLEWFDAAMLDGAMLVNWRTASEAGALGFNVLRRAEAEEAFAPVNMELILAQFAGQEQGAVYEFRDEGLPPGVYVYRLEGIGLDGSAATLGEVTVTVQ